jgi:hypothetical protein
MTKISKIGVKKPFSKDSLIVDHGVKRVIMPYKASLMHYYTREINEEIKPWCEKTFEVDTWRISVNGGHGLGCVYFEHERDLTIFLLRWAQ